MILEAKKIAYKKWYDAHRTEQLLRMKEQKKLHPEWQRKSQEKNREAVRRYRLTHPAVHRRSSWVKQGILTEDGKPFEVVDFDRLYQIQQGRCKMCARHASEIYRHLCVDHNHETGKVRSLLCDKCNLHVGYYENKTWKTRVEKYLNGGSL